MSSDTTKLDRFAQEHDGDLDALSLDRAESLNDQLRKRNSFKRRGMDRRAAELKAEVADAIDADVDVSANDEGDDGPTTETLSANTIEAALGRILKCGLDMDALHSRASVEKHQQRLERKRRTCESREMPNRAAELAEEIAVLEAAHDEARQATGRYSESDVETLAARVASEGYVLTTGPNGGLTARQTGGSE